MPSMKKHNLSDNVHFSGRILHLQTHTLSDAKHIVSTLFDRGRVIDRRERDIDIDTSPDIVHSTVVAVHHTRKQEILFLDRILAEIIRLRHGPSLFRLGRLLLAWHFYDDARAVLEPVDGNHPLLPDNAFLLSEIYLRLGLYAEAEALIRRAVGKAPENADLRLQLGWIYHRMSETDQAEDAIREALRLRPDSPRAYLFLGIQLLRGQAIKNDQTGSEKTMAALKKAVALSPEFRSKTIVEAFQRIDAGDHGSALNILEGMYDRTRLLLPAESDFFFLNYLYGEGKRDGESLRRFQAWINQELARNPGQVDRLSESAMTGLVRAHDNLRTVMQILNDAENDSGKRLLLPFSKEKVAEIYMKTGDLIKQYFKQGG